MPLPATRRDLPPPVCGPRGGSSPLIRMAVSGPVHTQTAPKRSSRTPQGGFNARLGRVNHWPEDVRAPRVVSAVPTVVAIAVVLVLPLTNHRGGSGPRLGDLRRPQCGGRRVGTPSSMEGGLPPGQAACIRVHDLEAPTAMNTSTPSGSIWEAALRFTRRERVSVRATPHRRSTTAPRRVPSPRPLRALCLYPRLRRRSFLAGRCARSRLAASPCASIAGAVLRGSTGHHKRRRSCGFYARRGSSFC
jgi:hypothetical protein